MENILLKTFEEYKNFCTNEELKEKEFLQKNGDAFHFRAYKYLQNYTNTTDFNLLAMLVDDEEFLDFPLEIEIMENPLIVNILGETQYYFDDPQKAFDLANKLHKEGKNVDVEGHGVYYEYLDDFYFLNLNGENKNILQFIERENEEE